MLRAYKYRIYLKVARSTHENSLLLGDGEHFTQYLMLKKSYLWYFYTIIRC